MARALLGAALSASMLLAACSGDGGGGGSTTPGNTTCEDGKQSYASTWEGVQKVIFEKHGCTEQICHGSAKSGGLDLSPAAAYENIVETKSVGSSLRLIEPGDNDRSYLWLKLAAKTAPGSVQISGSPMPNNLPAISADELELLRLWIYGGAPKTGTVQGTEKLLDACLPEPEPIVIKPLEPLPPDEGVQFVMPEWDLPKKSEREYCFATYYDFSGRVPPEYLDPKGEMFRFSGFELRQDPSSHHLLLYYSPLNLQPGGVDTSHPSFGGWTCQGGPKNGETCEPKDIQSCGEGICRSAIKPAFACVGYGPPSAEPAQIMGGAGQSQAYLPFADGVFAQIPIKGVIYWNSHAFNLTNKDTKMNGRLNYTFAKKQTHPVLQINDFGAIFKPNNPPFTSEVFCNDHVFPIGSRVFHLFAHMHRHGKHYWATLPDGTQIYETFSYTDPTQQRYDPPLAFDSPDPKERTVRYCAVYNNGLNEDGSFDTELVTRASRVPPQGFKCTPEACVAGRVGAACNGADDDRTCDSSPGANDGDCDACRITGGESTENEMFVLFGAQYIDEEVARAAAIAGFAAPMSVPPVDERGRSLATGPIFPHFQGCVSPDRTMGAIPGIATPTEASGSCHGS